MRVVHTVAELRQTLAGARDTAFVPTMGNLHDGHLALVREARARGAPVVASIFVNRLQFAPHEDFDRYPRTLSRDCDLLRAMGCNLVFAPSESELYPEPQTFKVQPDPALADLLEGQFRPGFFTGVCTVVMKLFQCVQPRVAIFGKKDYQQLLVVRRMVSQFALPIDVVGLETSRSDTGLALSSRNAYLSPEEAEEALQLSASLRSLQLALRAIPREHLSLEALSALETDAMARLSARGWKPDYVAIRRRFDLQVPRLDRQDAGAAGGPADDGGWVALAAARLGTTRLIDNLEL